MQLGEITYTEGKKLSDSFQELHLTRSDIIFSENNQYATLRLKQSKTDANYTGMLIMLTATNSSCCPMQALRSLFTHDPQAPSSSLFALNNTAFTRRYVIELEGFALKISRL